MENTVFTNSVNMIFMVESELGKLLNSEKIRRNLSIRDFAELIGITHPTLSAILGGDTPSYDLCVKIAPVVHLPLESTLRLAGLLPEAPEETEESAELLHLAAQLPEAQRRQLLEYARFLLGQVEQSRGKKR